MPKTKTQKYLVIVVPSRPKHPVTTQIGGVAFGQANYTLAPPTIVKEVDASSEMEAAEKVGVPAGATAHVAELSQVCRFTRPAEAKLEAA